MGSDALWGFAGLGVAAAMFVAGIIYAARGESTTAAVLIIAGAVLTLAGMP